MGKQEDKIVAGVAPMLETGEQALAALIAQPKGTTKGVAGTGALGAVAGSAMGGTERRNAHEAAEAAGLLLGSPCALVLTNQRLLTVKIGAPIGMGLGGKVKEVLSSVPIADVTSIETKKVALRQNITLHVRGEVIPLEANAAAGGEAMASALTSLRG